MLGFAVVDNQPGENEVAVWVVSRTAPQQADNVNAVVIDRASDPAAVEKLRSLTRSKVVVLTAGSVAEPLPVGEALGVDDVDELVHEVERFRRSIVEAVEAYAHRTHSKTVAPPVFGALPKRADFVASEDTSAHRALQCANFLNRVWTAWLKTDEQRRRRTVRPKTNQTPWMMPEDMNDPEIAVFPPGFGSRLRPEPQV